MSGKVRSGVASAGGVAPDPGQAVAPVDPDRRHREPLGEHVVVEQALRNVQDPLTGDVDPLERVLMVPERPGVEVPGLSTPAGGQASIVLASGRARFSPVDRKPFRR